MFEVACRLLPMTLSVSDMSGYVENGWIVRQSAPGSVNFSKGRFVVALGDLDLRRSQMRFATAESLPASLNACTDSEPAATVASFDLKSRRVPLQNDCRFYGACSGVSADASSPISSSISRRHSRDSQGRNTP